MCVEPESNTLLYYEEGTDSAPLIELFKKPLDEAYLLKVSKTYPDAETIVVAVEERTDSTDWTKKFQRLEFLP